MPGLSYSSVRTRNVIQSHPYTVRIEFCRTDHIRNSFIPRTSRLWNGNDSMYFRLLYDMLAFKRNVHKFFRLSPLHITQSYPNI